MKKPDNYQIQTRQAKDRFLTYDQESLIRKMRLDADEDYLYMPMLSQPVRIHRRSGDMERLTKAGWVSANSHGEVMTLLDLICDSAPDRRISGRWKSVTGFGLIVHTSLSEDSQDLWAQRFEAAPDALCRACEALGGQPFPQGDIAYVIELFDGLPVVVQLWFSDEEFPASLRLLWDENTLQYIKYETVWFAKDMILNRLAEEMESHGTV